MTFIQFQRLDEMEQIEAIWTGTELAEVVDGAYRITLMQIDNFYVELYHHIEHDSLTKIISYESLDELAPYLNGIDKNRMS